MVCLNYCGQLKIHKLQNGKKPKTTTSNGRIMLSLINKLLIVPELKNVGDKKKKHLNNLHQGTGYRLKTGALDRLLKASLHISVQ